LVIQTDGKIIAGGYVVAPQKPPQALIPLSFIAKAVDKNLQDSAGKSKITGRFVA
jgi:hypothetical protein